MRRRSKNSTTRITSRMISGPMPSPGRTRTLRFERESAIFGSPHEVTHGGQGVSKLCPGLGHAEEPGPRQTGLFLVAGDLGALLFGEPDIVEPVQHAVLPERVDVEMHDAAV